VKGLLPSGRNGADRADTVQATLLQLLGLNRSYCHNLQRPTHCAAWLSDPPQLCLTGRYLAYSTPSSVKMPIWARSRPAQVM
jgi:hypothetical protein